MDVGFLVFMGCVVIARGGGLLHDMLARDEHRSGKDGVCGSPLPRAIRDEQAGWNMMRKYHCLS